MNVQDFNFDQLIHPVEPNKFFLEYWEKQPLILSREERDYYSQLITIDDLDRILFYSRPQPPEIKVVHNQQEMLPSRYLQPGGSLNLNQLYKAYAEDQTLIINNVHQFWHPLAVVCDNLRSFLNHHLVANLYFSPANSQGLFPHYDTHDVFVLQIAGSKVWQIHQPWQKVPLLGSFQPVIPEEKLNEPIYSVKLKAGDLLYLPRGFIHHAKTENDSSLHVTLGIYPVQWLDLIVSALTSLSSQNEHFRQALPIGYLDNLELKSIIKEQWTILLKSMTENLSSEAGLEIIRDSFIRQTIPLPDGHFTQINNLNGINLQTIVKKRNNFKCRIIEQFNSVSIQFPANTIKGQPHLTSAMKFVADINQQFTVEQLPNNLTDNGKITLVKRLISGGLLQVINSPEELTKD